MEVNAKVKELEEEVKVLKAEIRNVLLDIREVILNRTNPLGDEHESAFIRMDLNTTAHAMAAEAAAHEAQKASDAASHTYDEHPSHHDAEAAHGQEDLPTSDGKAPAAEPEEPDDAPTAGPPPVHTIRAEEPEAAVEPEEGMPMKRNEPEPEVAPISDLETEDVWDEAPAEPPRVYKRAPVPTPDYESEPLPEVPEIPPMYLAGKANLAPLSGNGSLAAWVTQALEIISPQELERVIAIHRLWGNLPPNISRALAYLQELLKSSEEGSPAWLRVMQDLDRLASL